MATELMMLKDARAPYLILAHHRSGSNFLNDVLQAHPNIECLNEPLSMHTSHFRDFDLAHWQRQDFDRRLLHASLAQDEPLRHFLFDLKDYLLESNSSRVLGFKETVLFGKLEWLKEFLPNLKVVFLKRDIRAVVSSILRSKLTDLWQYAELVPAAFKRMHPHFTTLPISPDPTVQAAELAAMSVVLRYGLAQQEIRLFDHRVLSLEDIVQKPDTCLRVITDLLGVESHEAPLAFLQSRQTTSRGGVFSSFRSPEDTQHAWTWHLNARQLQVIDAVASTAQEAHHHA